MCIILPVDHLACTHTVAIWQHCIDAPRSKIHGVELCSRIRQHPRPILTRKLCFNCGGPRFFARRGGIAERGRGSTEEIQEEKAEHSDPNDSGYHSEAITEEDEEDDDFSLSPRTPRVKASVWKRKENVNRHRSPSRRPSWKPNLKRELTGDSSPFCRRESIDSTVSKFEDGIGRAPRSQWPPFDNTPPILQTPAPRKRKNSTLLHPSSPPAETTINLQNATSFPFTPSPLVQQPSTRPQRPPPPTRKTSTLLHPSPPSPVTTTNPPTVNSFPFPQFTPLPQPSTPPHRKNSTLLHPSPPPTNTTTTLPITRPKPRRASILHSSFSDTEPDYESDTESSQDDATDNDYSYHLDKEPDVSIVLATTAKMARASRISFHGADFRVLRA